MIEQSIIISYKESDEDRRRNLKRILSYLSELLDYLSKLLNNETEIILVEQGDVSKINWLDEFEKKKQINHIFLKNKGIFNKGWGYNVGANEARGQYLIFNDIDVFLPFDKYYGSLTQMPFFDVINPYNKIFFLNSQNTEKFISNKYDFNNIDPLSPHYLPGVISGGIFLMKKKSFLMIKGFDEECYGYGHEDDIFDMKIKKLGSRIQYRDGTAAHIFHQVDKTDNDYYSRINFNADLFKQYQLITSEQLRTKIRNLDYFGRKKI